MIKLLCSVYIFIYSLLKTMICPYFFIFSFIFFFFLLMWQTHIWNVNIGLRTEHSLQYYYYCWNFNVFLLQVKNFPNLCWIIFFTSLNDEIFIYIKYIFGTNSNKASCFSFSFICFNINNRKIFWNWQESNHINTIKRLSTYIQ